ncbi:16S rRNA m(2)G 1207 methyltransferase [Orbus hercynius]|uniref:Ribosomal RNA small subunit methyltransferase C n=1 Tax=Orbus hercynius TaxID=593135 RepID=A0A495RKS0_9GAMM|nr:16S rRNA (guanine(1207)-N(2))-methyltransferase RsmC [Orbus hercynius]RKS87766.1 16S rRNA m(2)G 1207 methyltransferase [Orbus hercynius]
MSALTPSSQVLQRHEALFYGKNILVAGDFHDDYVLQLETAATKIHCTLFHLYSQLKKRYSDKLIEFGVMPTDACYENTNTLIYYWPKNKHEAQFQLAYLLNHLAQGTDIFIVGENRSGVKSAETLLTSFGTIQKIDTARRCSLYHFNADSRLAFDIKQWWHQYELQLDKLNIKIDNLPGVFSQRTLDTGSDLLLNALIDNTSLIRGRVLDVGCGCGVLSAVVAKINPSIELICVDVSAVALASTTQTLLTNGIDGEVIASDVFSDINGRFDLIVSNPPFHDGKETDYSAIETLIAQSRAYLAANGKLCIVANSFLPYHRLLAEHFKRVDVIAQTTKFKVYLAN